MATLEDAVDAALPLVRSLEERLAEVAEHLAEAAGAIEEAERKVEEAWTPFESAAAALLDALPAHGGELQEQGAAARQALSDLPLVDASGGGGVALGESVSHALLPAVRAVDRFGQWLRAAIPPLRETEAIFRERTAAPTAERLAELEAGMDSVAAGVREGVTEVYRSTLLGLAEGLGQRIDELCAQILGQLVPSFIDDGVDWTVRLAEAERATAEEAFAAARQMMDGLLQDGHAARVQAANDALDELAEAAGMAEQEVKVLSAEVEAQALDHVTHCEDLAAQTGKATAALRTAAGHLASSQDFLAALGFGDAC
jgi:hypothetical protein